MITWILGKMSSKAILWVALSSLGVNVLQFGWHKIAMSGSQTDKELVQLAINDALQKQQQLQTSQVIKEKDAEIVRLKEQKTTLDALVADKVDRGDRWKADALKFKKYYEKNRCKDEDIECEAWGSADYRGDG